MLQTLVISCTINPFETTAPAKHFRRPQLSVLRIALFPTNIKKYELIFNVITNKIPVRPWPYKTHPKSAPDKFN